MKKQFTSEEKVLDAFKEYLIKEGYSVTTPSGHPSTVYDYQKRIKKVCVTEGITIFVLIENIDKYVQDYDIGGNKEVQGKQSHNAVINALRRFSEFLR